MILHTLHSLPTGERFDGCLKTLAAEDALLLLGDGVYAALADTAACQTLEQSNSELYALSEHVLAAGISGRLSPGVTLIGYAQFVALTERFPRQLAWY